MVNNSINFSNASISHKLKWHKQTFHIIFRPNLDKFLKEGTKVLKSIILFITYKIMQNELIIIFFSDDSLQRGKPQFYLNNSFQYRLVYSVILNYIFKGKIGVNTLSRNMRTGTLSFGIMSFAFSQFRSIAVQPNKSNITILVHRYSESLGNRQL